MYKLIFLLSFFVTLNFSYGQNQNATELIENALKKAQLEKKQVYVNYLSIDCKKSEQVVEQMNDLDVKALLESNYVLVNITVPKKEVSEFVNCSNPMKSFSDGNCEQISFPFSYILDVSGKHVEISYLNEKKNTQLISLK